MTNLTERQIMILNLVVEEYVNSAQPVGSKYLVQKYDLDVSPATVRNEMVSLAEAGYLRQPHTSAGRVPTEDGYRVFVSTRVKRPGLPRDTQKDIQKKFTDVQGNTMQWMRLAASVLAHQSQAASIVTAPVATRVRYKHLQLISTAGRQVLMVLVLMGGEVSQQMLVLSEPVSQERLSAAARAMNNLFHGRAVEEMNSANLVELDALGQDMFKLVMDELKHMDQPGTGEVYQDGWSNVLNESGFSESETARKALRLLEEPPLLDKLLSESVMDTEIGGVRVLIGGEGTWEELRECSLVLARYGVSNIASGVLGVLGPIRMPYEQTISTVDYVAGLLSDMVSSAMGNGELPAGLEAS